MAALSLNVDPQVICPYNESHIIAKSRLRQHLVKCEKNYPPNYKVTCPYDATHRFFEYEMEGHVQVCPQKWPNLDWQKTKMPETDDTDGLVMTGNDEWDEDGNNFERLPKEPEFNTIQPVPCVTAFRGNAVTAKRIGSTLRRPYGLPEAMMLDVPNPNAQDENDTDDTASISSEMNWGRGRALLGNQGSSVRPVRGIGILHKRGFRGRLA